MINNDINIVQKQLYNQPAPNQQITRAARRIHYVICFSSQKSDTWVNQHSFSHILVSVANLCHYSFFLTAAHFLSALYFWNICVGISQADPDQTLMCACSFSFLWHKPEWDFIELVHFHFVTCFSSTPSVSACRAPGLMPAALLSILLLQRPQSLLLLVPAVELEVLLVPM